MNKISSVAQSSSASGHLQAYAPSQTLFGWGACLPEDQSPAAGSQTTCAMANYLRALFAQAGMHREHFHAIFLDANKEFLDQCTLTTGDRWGLSMRMRQLFARALHVDTKAMVIAHNHPSGQCQPSARDISATRKIVQFATAVDISLLDHLIITPTRAYSMRAGGIL